MKKKIIYFAACCLGTLFIASCSTKDPNSPGFEYMPDMYRSPSYETNSGNGIFADSMTNRKPVEGTIAYDWAVSAYYPYPFPNSTAGYDSAGVHLKDPFPATQEVLDQGKFLYSKFCVHCHGESGGGDGLVGSKLPGPPPAYNSMMDNGKLRAEGKFYHTITWGKGLMGSHASQLSPDERWKVIRYIQTFQGVKFDAAGWPMMEMPKDSVKDKKEMNDGKEKDKNGK